MRLFIFKLVTYAAVFAGLLLFMTSCCKEDPEVSASPSSLTFEADDTQEKTLTIETNASDWKIQGVSAAWIDAYRKADDRLYVKVQDYTDTNASRTGTITVSASISGKTASADINIEQLRKKINTLSVNPASLTYEANETGNKTVSVSTDAPNWETTNPNVSWIQLTPQGQTLVVNVSSANTQTDSRTADIAFTAGNAPPVTLRVTQGAKDVLSVNTTSLNFSANESSQTVTITTTASTWSYSIESGSSWITTTKNNNSLVVSAVRNTTTSSRTGRIRVSAGSATDITINVTQAASKNTLTVTPNVLELAYTTSPGYFTVSSDASSWTASKNNADTWFTASVNSGRLQITPQANNTTQVRSAYIEFTAGNADPVTVTVRQAGRTGTPVDEMPVRRTCSYSATATVVEYASGFNTPNWSGQILAYTAAEYIAIANWANTSSFPPLWLDWKNGQFQLDVTTGIETTDDTYDLYWCIGTISGGIVTPRPGVNFTVPYNQSTQVLSFSNTYQGLPTCVMLIPRNRNNGQWDTTRYYGVIYRNTRIQITSSPQSGSQSVNAGDSNGIPKKTSFDTSRLKLEMKNIKDLRIED